MRPRLPGWLPELTLRNLRVGNATVSLRFRRQEDGSADHEVIERDGVLLVTTFPAPDASAGVDMGWEDRIKEWALEHLPGRMARALRIARGDTAIEPGP